VDAGGDICVVWNRHEDLHVRLRVNSYTETRKPPKASSGAGDIIQLSCSRAFFSFLILYPEPCSTMNNSCKRDNS
jgi:hypothetical protein